MENSIHQDMILTSIEKPTEKSSEFPVGGRPPKYTSAW
jgi:hypothetical protein